MSRIHSVKVSEILAKMTKYIYNFVITLFICSSVIGQQYVNQERIPARTNTIDDVYLRFYNGSSTDQYVQFPLTQASRLFNIVGFDQNKFTVFYAHGFTESANSESAKTVASSYIEARPETNYVAIDWSNFLSTTLTTLPVDYIIKAAPSTKPVGLALAAQINTLINSGLDVTKIHLIGHSLGAQMVGYAARTLKNTYSKTLKRITGLDPAFPKFYPEDFNLEHIKPTDADFVDVIHTDAGALGAPVSTGTPDFWPNGGRAFQPGCSLAMPIIAALRCNHDRAWQYYAESVRTPTAFAASPASSYIMFQLNCNPQVGMVYMGYNCSSSAAGNYYLYTNSKSPYGKGLDGLKQ